MLIRPVILKIYPFNATQDYIVKFNAVGGDQIFGNNIVIKDNLDNTIIFDDTIDNFKFEHIIPANTLTNGKAYNITIRTKNSSNSFSDFSDAILFQCYSNAIVIVNNITDNIVNNQSYLFKFTYTQTENITIQSYKVFLYNENEILISESGVINQNLDTLQYEFTNLQNNKKYYIECKILNQIGMESTTGKVPFTAKYIQPKMSNIMELDNDYFNASINVNIKIIRAIFKPLDGKITFEDNEWINLKNGSVYTDYENGLDLNGKWTLKLYIKGLEENDEILQMSNDNIILKLVMYGNRIHLYKYYKKFNDYKIHIASNMLDSIGIDDTICIWLQNTNGGNNLKIEKIVN